MYPTKSEKTISCPKCGAAIDVNAVVYQQAMEELSKEYDAKIAEEKKVLEYKEDELGKGQKTLEQDRKALFDTIKEGVFKKLQVERPALEVSIRKNIIDETSEQYKEMQRELGEKSEQLKGLHKANAEIERLKREKEEQKAKIEEESQQKLTKALNEARATIRKEVESKEELKYKELEDSNKRLTDDLAEAQRKSQESSGRSKGEVMELAIEEWLRTTFPLDTVDEIKKGARGADCIQTVNTHTRQNCGSIYYESKRANKFQPIWIEKFKEDMRLKHAHVGVIVTETMPTDMTRMGLKEGVWVCSYEEFKGLCAVLRESVVQISNAIVTQENKGEKMTMLYDYLTSNEFKLQLDAIVDGFTQMKDDLESEKRSFERAWKTREKQIEKVLLNTTHMYGSLRGIAGSAIPTVQQLEFKPGIQLAVDAHKNN